MERAINLEDVREMARRRLPRVAFDFIDGGVEDEVCLRRNREAFSRHTIVPRYLVDVQNPVQAVTLFGRTYASPFGISPAGLAGMFRPEADRMLAEEAASANIPFLMSSASGLSVEQAAAIGSGTTWFQVYGTRDPAILDRQVGRARDCGISTLVFTVDVPVVPRRERNIRNGFSRPLKLTPGLVLDGLAHPAWLWGFLRSGGVPDLANWTAEARSGATKEEVADLFGANTPAPNQDWTALDRVRAAWPGNLVVKGILDPRDALAAVDAGADALIVSNHGGRQLDCAPSPIEMLPVLRRAVKAHAALLIDSGVRRGTDVLVSRCLGAEFAFFARPTLFGVAAAGARGIRKVIEIVRTEIDIALSQLGCPDISGLGPDWLTENIVANLIEEAGPARNSRTAPAACSTGRMEKADTR